MTRIHTPATVGAAPASTHASLKAVARQLGVVPNLFRVVAEIEANRSGASSDPKADAAVRFAAAVVRQRGQVSNEQVAAVRNAGYSDAQVLDILLAVALTTCTNDVNEVAQTEIDFPVVQPLRLAA